MGQIRKRQRPWARTTLALLSVLAPAITSGRRSAPKYLRSLQDIGPSTGALELSVTSPPVFQDRQENAAAPILKRAHPMEYLLELEVSTQVDLSELLQELDGVLEDYIASSLDDLQEKRDWQVRDVSVSVRLQRRRQLQQQQQQQRQLRSVNVLMEGAVSYELDSTVDIDEATINLEKTVSELLLAENVNTAIQDSSISNVDDVLTSRQATEDRQTITETEANAANDGETPPGNDGGLARPSTLSIVFGFVLTGIATLGLCVYAWIFYRKRKKRLRRKKQRMESIQYRGGPIKSGGAGSSTTSATPRPTPPMGPARKELPPHISATMPSNEESEDSSYRGLHSMSSEGPGDSFARELQMAASLDDMAWNDFQRKKQALDRNEMLKATDVGSTKAPITAAASDDLSSKRWAKSFPYGDEPAPSVDWDTANGEADSDVANTNWGIGYQTVGEEKKDDVYPRDPSANIESIERTLSEFGDAQDDDADADETNSFTRGFADIVNEVAKLSRFVQKYEKRKERRIQREQERSVAGSATRSFDMESDRASAIENIDPVGSRGSLIDRERHAQPEEIRGSALQKPSEAQSQKHSPSYLNNMRNVAGSARVIDATGMITSLGGFEPDPALDALSNDLLSVSDDFSDDTDRDEESQVENQRLGITPFSVQKQEDGSFEAPMTPMMRKLSQNEAIRLEQRHRGDVSLPTDEHQTDRKRATSDGDHYANRNTLSRLRNNSAIIDSSKSDVNVAWDDKPQREKSQAVRAQPQPTSRIPQLRTSHRTPTNAQAHVSPNPRFNRLRNLFEERPRNAIFPPDQNWQTGGSKGKR